MFTDCCSLLTKSEVLVSTRRATAENLPGAAEIEEIVVDWATDPSEETLKEKKNGILN